VADTGCTQVVEKDKRIRALESAESALKRKVDDFEAKVRSPLPIATRGARQMTQWHTRAVTSTAAKDNHLVPGTEQMPMLAA
jgi:hypothetical protein